MAARGLKVAMLALLVLACWWGTANGDICTTTINDLVDCRGYVLGLSSSVSGSCCSAVKKLYLSTSGYTQLAIAKRRQICNCFKQYAGILNAQHVSALPAACNVKLSYTISSQTVRVRRNSS